MGRRSGREWLPGVEWGGGVVMDLVRRSRKKVLEELVN